MFYIIEGSIYTNIPEEFLKIDIDCLDLCDWSCLHWRIQTLGEGWVGARFGFTCPAGFSPFCDFYLFNLK